MSFNYRVVRHKSVEIGGVQLPETLCIHRVYYDEHGNPDSYGEDPAEVEGDDVNEIRRVLRQFERALDEPVLDAEQFG